MIVLHDTTVRVSQQALAPASNISNKELIALVDNEFPALQGALRLMFERFKECQETQLDRMELSIDCPCCGTQITLVWDNT